MVEQEPTPDDWVEGLEDVPEIFVEGYRGAYFRAGVVKLNFFSNQPRGEGLVTKRAAVALTIPLTDLREVLPALQALIAQIDQAVKSGEHPSS